MENINIKFGRRVKELRLIQNISQELCIRCRKRNKKCHIKSC